MLDILSCTIGGANMSDYRVIPNITVTAINAIKIFVPIILIVFGMIDLSKAVMSNDEKEMKGAQTKLIKRAIYAVVVFLVISIVQLLFSALAGAANDDQTMNKSTIQDCVSCFVSDTKKC